MANDTGDLTAAAGIGINALSGNWLGAAIGAVGLGASLLGGLGQANDSKQMAQLEEQKAGVSMNTAQLEMQQDTVRQQAMELSSRRSQLENVRNTQRARAMAIQAGVSQGAQYGSGNAGGVASTQSQGGFGLGGILQNTQAGESMFALNRSIDANKITMAQLGGQEASVQGNAATWAGVSAVGGALTNSGGALGKMSGGFNFNSLFGGGSPSGYGTGG